MAGLEPNELTNTALADKTRWFGPDSKLILKLLLTSVSLYGFYKINGVLFADVHDKMIQEGAPYTTVETTVITGVDRAKEFAINNIIGAFTSVLLSISVGAIFAA
jgi:hypothetical protein